MMFTIIQNEFGTLKDVSAFVEMCKDYLDADLSEDSLSELKSAFSTAKKYTEVVASQSQLSEAIYDLTRAYTNLEPSSPDETTGKFTFSVGRFPGR